MILVTMLFMSVNLNAQSFIQFPLSTESINIPITFSVVANGKIQFVATRVESKLFFAV